jgi:CRISPR/Cas system CSM-associated protein Csm3 (group 7 of RAMP superfamily)
MSKGQGKGEIRERIYMQGQLKALSPLIIGSGEERHTDIDLLRDAEGMPFIPGTSLAGSIRHFLEAKLDEEEKTVLETVFGKKDKESIQSSVMFFDAPLLHDSPFNVSTRDGIRLNYETKTVDVHIDRDEASGGAKYDYEIIETGARFDFRMEMTIRDTLLEQIEKDRLYDLVFLLVESLQDCGIALGAKTRRGFGSLRLQHLNILHLHMKEKEDVKKWLEFEWPFQSSLNISHFKRDKLQLKEDKDIHISINFKIPYSLLIRHYSIHARDADASHLMSGENPVIPGTSWNGAISHSVYNILKELDHETLWEKEVKEQFFGTEKGKKPRASRIIFRESIINNHESVTYTRNKVDRFTGGVVETALFDEKPVFGGDTSLEITIKDAEPWEVGLILLALNDLSHGIQTIGGDANIGRGILQGETININKQPLSEEKFYYKELYKYLSKKKGKTNGRRKEIK